VIQYYEEATKHDKNWYKAWHLFAYLNYEAVLFYKQQRLAATDVTPAATASSDSVAARPDESRAEVGSWNLTNNNS